MKNLDECEILTRQELGALQSTRLGWSRPKDQQNKTDKFLSVYGVMYAIVNSRNKKGKELRKWILSDIIPQDLNEKMKKLRKNYQQAREEKDETFALFNNDLQDLHKEIQAIKYWNVGLQSKIHAKDQLIKKCENTIKHLTESYVYNARNSGLDHVVIIVCKQTSQNNDEHFDCKYYIARI